MGWQDDPVVGADSQPAAKSSGGGWQADPVVGAKGGGSAPAATTPQSDSPWLIATDADHPSKVGEWLRTAIHSGTLGADDYLQAGVNKLGVGDTDKGLTQLQTDAANQRSDIGPYGALSADLVGYGVGVGKLGLGARLAEGLGGRLAARAVGAGAENAGATLVGDELNTQGAINSDPGSLLKDLAISGTVGSLTGAIPGGKGRLADVPNPTPALKTASDAAFAPLKNAEFHPGDIGPAYDGAVSSISSGQKIKLDGDFKAKMAEISQEMADKYKANKPITADDIASYSQALRDNANGPLEQNVAGDLDRALHGAVSNANPAGTSQTGAQVSQAIKDANAAAEQKNASQNMDDWIKQAQSGKAASVPDAINNKLDNNSGFFKQPGVRDALSDAAQPPGTVSKLLMAAAHPAMDAAIGTGAGYFLGGQDLGSSILEGAVTGIGGAAARHTLSQARTNSLVNKLAAARHLNATGQTVNPSDFRQGNRVLSPLATYAPRVGVGVGASNMFNDLNNQ